MTEQCSLACSLIDLVQGQNAVLDHFACDEGAKNRVLRLGLTPGRRLVLMQNKRSGCIVATAGARIALDYSLAAQIFVIPSQESSLEPST